jgi:hypothetical protein
MKSFVVSILIFCALSGCAVTSSAPRPSDVPSPSIANTYWRGVDSDGPIVLHLQPDHIVHYQGPSGNYTNGRWSQRNSELRINYNNHYSDLVGTIADCHIVGTGANVAGNKQTWWLVRLAKRPKELTQ